MSSPAPSPTQGALSHKEVLTVITGLMVGLFIAAIDVTIVATALPAIVGDLGGIDMLSWVVVAYLLTSTAATPLWGKIGDLYGRRHSFQAAIVIFVVGSLACGLAPTMFTLVLARALQGIGGGGLFALTFAIVGDVISPRQRGRYMGYFTATFASAGVLGPLLGGFITDAVGWRWIFVINLPIGIVALIVTTSALRLPFPRRKARLDLAGAVMIVVAVVLLTLVTVWGGSTYPWGSPLIIGMGVASVALFAGFVAWERRAPEPLVPLRLFGNSVAALAFLVSFLLGPMMYGMSTFLPLYLQGVSGVSATSSGLLLAPAMLGLTVTSILAGRMTTSTGRYKVWILLGAALLVVTTALLGTLGATTSVIVVGGMMALLGAGLGAAMPTLTTATQNAVDITDLGVATSTLTFSRTLGGSVGVAALGAVLTVHLDDALGRIGRENALADGVTAESLANEPTTIKDLVEPLRGLVEGALADAVAAVYQFATPIAVIAFVTAWFIKELPLRDFSSIGATAKPASSSTAAPTSASTSTSTSTSTSGEPTPAGTVAGPASTAAPASPAAPPDETAGSSDGAPAEQPAPARANAEPPGSAKPSPAV